MPTMVLESYREPEVNLAQRTRPIMQYGVSLARRRHHEHETQHPASNERT